MFFPLSLSCPLLPLYPCLPKMARSLGVYKSAKLDVLRAACQLSSGVGLVHHVKKEMAHYQAVRCGVSVQVL